MRAASVPADDIVFDTAVPAAPPTFDEVYEEHFDYVYRVVVRLAGREQAEDLAQDVFAVVHRRLGEFEGRARITTWLFQIAYRVVGAHIRRERLRRALLAAVGVAGDEPTPAAALRGLERAAEAAGLVRALARLSWKKRAVLVLHEVEGWSCDLIAERMGVPTPTVYTRLHHARKELAELLGGGRRDP